MGFKYHAQRGAFGWLMKCHRKRLRLSLMTFGGRVRRTHTFISRVESGARKPPLEEMETWADVLCLNKMERATYRTEAALAHVPEDMREEVRSFLRAEGVRQYRAQRNQNRAQRQTPRPTAPMEVVSDPPVSIDP